MRVGVVGTGRMGAAMVGRLVGAGHDVTVYNRTRSRAEAVAAAHGLPVAPTPREAAVGAEVVLVSLADDAALRSAYLGPDGIVAGLGAGSVVADTSTVDPETVRELDAEVSRAGATLVDTPVSGSVSVVEAGDLLVMAGGDEAAVDHVRPVLDSFARRVLLLGPLGAGATMKLAVNSLVHGLNVALAEALVLAEQAGVERSAAYEVFASGATAAPFVLYKRQAYEHPEDAAVAFALDLVAKDLDLAAAMASRVGAEVPQLSTNREIVQRALDAGLGQSDMSAVAEVIRRNRGVDLPG
jgi:3-hydroxyisobutyrate dehydrogenase/2-hydroxy-3-oxopropionate reductase